MKIKTAAVSFLVTSLWPVSALAGVVFEVETTYHSGTPGVETSEMSVEKPNLKMEIASRRDGTNSSQKEDAIFRGDRREMVVVNHEEQYYMVMDAAAAKRVSGQAAGAMNQVMKDMEKHLEGLDPKQREMMENMLKGNMGGAMGHPGSRPAPPQRIKNEFRKTPNRATKQGYPCVRYDVMRGSEKVQELWVTDWNNIKGGAQIEASFEDMADFFEEMMDSFSDGMGGDGFFGNDGPSFDTFTEIDGFPVVTREFEGGELESESVLKSVTERDLDPDAFEPPKGYRLRTMGPQ